MKSENLGRTTAIATAAVLALFLVPTITAAQEFQDVKRSAPITLEGEGSFFIDGFTQTIDSKYLPPTNSAYAGKSMTNQMYVQFQKPLLKNGKFPACHRARLLPEFEILADDA